MLSYDEIKKWCSVKENKDRLILIPCFILVFLVGFGTGRFDRSIESAQQKSQPHYTTPAPAKPTPTKAAATPTVGTVAGTSTPASCLIKGNISSNGRKIYHIPTGALYKVVKPEQCFNTEAEALAAGFVKSGR
jgi:hypothetical protein